MKSILITGASSGIGYGLVNKFLSNGYHIFAISRNITPLLELKNNNITTIQADITNLSDKKRILKEICNLEFNIINNAAYAVPSIFKDSTITDIRQHFETNVFAPLELIQELLNKNRVSRVLNISSGAAEFPLQSLLSYCSSKAAIHHAIKCLNLEYSDTKFINLRPGMVDTPLQDRWSKLDKNIFPNGDFYKNAKLNNQFISVETVSNFVYWVMQLPINDFSKSDWNINDKIHHQNWLKNQSLHSHF